MSISNTPLPSSKLKMMLEEINQVFREYYAARGRAKQIVMSTYNQAISEGFSPHEAGKLIYSKVKGLARRTIRLYLPDEAKDKKMQALAQRRRPRQNCRDKVKKTNSIEKSPFQLLREQKGSSTKPSESTIELTQETANSESTIELEEPETPTSESEIDLNEDVGQQIFTYYSKPGTVLLESKFSDLIHHKVNLNKSKGIRSEFILTHNGEKVVSVEDST